MANLTDYAPNTDLEQTQAQTPLQGAFLAESPRGQTPYAPPSASASSPATPQYDTTTPNWNGTGMTEAQWRTRYPIQQTATDAPSAPTAPAAPASGGPPGFVPGRNGGWVPPDHPDAARGAAPSGATPNSYYAAGPSQLDRANARVTEFIDQPDFDKNDPVFRGQVDQYAARTERARRQAIDEAAERGSTTGDGLSDAERAMITERAGQDVAGFEAELAQRELTARRDRTMESIRLALARGDSEAARNLQRELAQLDAAVKRESTAASTALGGRELDIRDRLGNRGLDLDAARVLLANQQFGQDLGFRIGSRQADLNNDALRIALGG